MKIEKKNSRRQFLKYSAASMAALSIAPRQAFGGIGSLAPVGIAKAQKKQYLAEDINLSQLETQFFQLCDVAVEEFKIPYDLPKRIVSRDLPPRTKSFYMQSYTVRALAVAYDLTEKEEYLKTIKNWANQVITLQQKMMPKGSYYMNYGRGPFEASGSLYNADAGEIAMGMLATAVRCSHPMEKQHYIQSVESFANLVLENYIGPNGGIVNGHWRSFWDEWWCCTAYVGQNLFVLYNETGNQRYLEAALNAVNWLANLESLRSKYSNDDSFLQRNPLPISPEGAEHFAGGTSLTIHCTNSAYIAGFPHIFSKYPELEKSVKKEINSYMKWKSKNLAGKGESATWDKYDVRSPNVGGKFGALPYHIYFLANNNIISNDMVKIADKELQRIVSELFSYNELQITEFASFAMMSMAEKISPGSILRKSKPMYLEPIAF